MKHSKLVAFVSPVSSVKESGKQGQRHLTLPAKIIDEAISAGFAATISNVTLKSYWLQRTPAFVMPVTVSKGR